MKKIFSFLATSTATFCVFSLTGVRAQSPVYVQVTESAAYTPAGAYLPGVQQDAKNQGKQGVVRSCLVTLTNLTDREVTVDLEYAMYKFSPKTGITPMLLSNMPTPKPTGRNQKALPPAKMRETLTLRPRETRQLKVDAWMPGEIGEGMRTKDLGQAVDRARYDYTYYQQTQYNNYYDYMRRFYNTNRQTDAPTPAKPVDQTALPAPEQYYGYSVAAYVGGQLVSLVEKNPQRVPKFGVTAQ
jgi:hypothetical protein